MKETFEKAVNVVQVRGDGGLHQGVAMKRSGLFQVYLECGNNGVWWLISYRHGREWDVKADSGWHN